MEVVGGDAILLARKKKNLSARTLARVMDVSEGSIRDLETGRFPTVAQVLKAIEEAPAGERPGRASRRYGRTKVVA